MARVHGNLRSRRVDRALMSTGIFRMLAWILIGAIVILSLAPPSRPPVTVAPHDLEHFAIFALCGYVFSLGYRSHHLLHAVALVAFAGLIEVLQFVAPGRHARMLDFVIDGIASCAGVLIGWVTLKVTFGEGAPASH